MRGGASTITRCPKCNATIHGKYYDFNPPIYNYEISLSDPPNFCHNCGKPYPWTESALKTVQDFIEKAERLSVEEKKILIESLEELIKLRDTPQEKAIATKFNKVFIKIGKETVEALKNILINVLGEVAKKIILP